MLRLALAQMRRSLGRLTAAAVAITIGTAFVVTTLLAGGVLTRSGYDAVTAQLGHADLVVSGEITDEDLAAIRATPGVVAADPVLIGSTEVRHGSSATWQLLLPTPSDERLASLVAAQGRMPARAGEVALPASTAKRLSVEVGDTVTTTEADETGEETTRTLDVVGITDDPASAWAQYGGAGLATVDDLRTWTGQTDGLLVSSVLVAAPDGTTAVQDALRADSPSSEVLTRDEAAAQTVEQLSGEGNALIMVVLGFAAVALLVAALVIANTFQVLVAQRTRTLALLRCVGASKGQLGRAVLVEAALLGFGASVVGLLAGTALAQGALFVLGRVDVDVPLPRTVDVTLAVVLVPLVVGTLVTVLASLVPARAATRVPPIAALRPSDAPSVSARGGRVRLVLALLLTIGGVGGLLAAVAIAPTGRVDAMLVLAFGLLAGAVSFVGVLLGGVFWVPRVVSLAGRALAATGASARIAAANTVRNPRRTAATSAALLIGVTLVAMMSTGAASARTSLARDLAERYPVDLVVESWSNDGETAALPASVAATVAGVPGVAAVATATGAYARVGDGVVHLRALDPGDADRVLRAADAKDQLRDGTLVLPSYFGDEPTRTTDVVPTDESGEALAGASSSELTVVSSQLGGTEGLTTPATLAGLTDAPVADALWVRLADDADAGSVLQTVRDDLGDETVSVMSAAADRQRDERVIDTLLAVVVGLLAVAVVIALVGVANTLSLSVLERRRESATLRAIGLTRRQLRWMLAVEGMLIAGVGAVLGVALGMLYGWAGAAVLFGVAGELHLAVPWLDLVLVLAVALVAGLLASVLPARTAARTPPVAALAVD